MPVAQSKRAMQRLPGRSVPQGRGLCLQAGCGWETHSPALGKCENWRLGRLGARPSEPVLQMQISWRPVYKGLGRK